MTKNRVRIDEAALRRAVQPSIDDLQARLNAELQSTIREVRDEMEGQPADQVFDTLVARLEERIPGLNLNEDTLRGVAAEIEAGTLTD